MSLPENPMLPSAEQSETGAEVEGQVGCRGGPAKMAEAVSEGAQGEDGDVRGAVHEGGPHGAVGAPGGSVEAVGETAGGGEEDLLHGISDWDCCQWTHRADVTDGGGKQG